MSVLCSTDCLCVIFHRIEEEKEVGACCEKKSVETDGSTLWQKEESGNICCGEGYAIRQSSTLHDAAEKLCDRTRGQAGHAVN